MSGTEATADGLDFSLQEWLLLTRLCMMCRVSLNTFNKRKIQLNTMAILTINLRISFCIVTHETLHLLAALFHFG